MDLERAVAAVDWAAVPGHPDWYRPEHAAAGLRTLASAGTSAEVRRAVALLTDGGLVHAHSAAVLPSAAVAAPILLSIAEHGPPLARAAALILLDDALSCSPHAGFTRASDGLPLCCAIAVAARRRATVILGHGRRDLLAEITRHWRVVVTDSAEEDTGTVILGTSSGTMPSTPARAEVVHHGVPSGVVTIAVEVAPAADGDDVLLRVLDAAVAAIPVAAVLVLLECALDVH